MAFSVPDLPYDYAALEPHIDEQTMRIHHDKHHQAYVDKANAALEARLPTPKTPQISMAPCSRRTEGPSRVRQSGWSEAQKLGASSRDLAESFTSPP